VDLKRRAPPEGIQLLSASEPPDFHDFYSGRGKGRDLVGHVVRARTRRTSDVTTTAVVETLKSLRVSVCCGGRLLPDASGVDQRSAFIEAKDGTPNVPNSLEQRGEKS
jgi:hypothetical protein